MKRVSRNEILPLKEYKKKHPEIRETIAKIKGERRVHVGPIFTFLFENHETIRYQIQEMIRAESLTSEEAIQHEIDTYNQLLPNAKELTATLLLEIDDPDVRKVKLKELLGLHQHISFRIDNDTLIKADFDDKQFNTERISSVQFIRFCFGEKASLFLNSSNIELASSHPYYSQATRLSEKHLSALKSDLSQS